MLALNIYLFFLCVNIMTGVLATELPWTGLSSRVPEDFTPEQLNATYSEALGRTSSEGGFTPFESVIGAVSGPLQMLYDIFAGGFVTSVLNQWGFPASFVYGFSVIMLFLLALTALQLARGIHFGM